ncbi:methyltransferase domain-containing protein [Methylococcus mesophilus]|uniref:methyltransferase domain-containing protein n=1 Tax=Methylococcus mesophilus TaxID=2993564 RepID=UPI00224B89EB|nr:methyltransferase domain-containing protein [Methylococcus mesophilus]UZR29535.1 methyltransferase domain-containing protein [Methylococcus mesophilus]
MANESHYIIRGGESGAERLHVLGRVMWPASLAVLGRAGLAPGMDVLDLGCGSGDMTLEIARVAGANGRVVGIDMDAGVLAEAKRASEGSGLPIEWRQGRIEEVDEDGAFDLVYARFLLSHLPDPRDALRRMCRAVRPFSRVVVEDIDISAHVHWPPSAAFRRYVELYTATALARGADPGIGPRLPALLIDAGLEDVEVAVSMPVFRQGEGKTVARITLSNIAESAIAVGLTCREEIDRLLGDLAGHEADPRSIQSTAQVFQVIGRRPLTELDTAGV